ncbi:response regulator transcription factor [Bradyrhizobium sp. U87765 SZCCT0131]|nr:response regulator transcription factor [Bradyrhizobium sp. U87765 SZCCT0131]MBR1264038.1 response regulator transcription factor [Bradyrhizobium sp. U87765 SZCCT0134]MBR1308179.1 response regulator transcription factor [Bradyrhizobium sp. U87765 SZCCT0110]MBR1320288.1 response regulator transcription factor [Bradyrhizobium sp. U87765 SZCCT0109]MBR1348599.1 response regulator transcription factor [Bradyrhizobium sp. U87765 SZCCT0048]
MRLFVVDDESHARRAIHQACLDHGGVTVAGEAASVETAVPLIKSVQPDAIILDVVMPGEEGFSLFRALDAQLPIIIYSGHAGRALEAFEAEAFDFLLKPVEPNRFSQVIGRLEQAIEQRKARAGGRPDNKASLPLRIADHTGYRLIQLDQILAVEAEKDFSRLLLASGENCFATLSIGRMEERLPNPPFVRLGRSMIVNCSRIDRIDPLDNGRGHLRFAKNLATLEVGRAAHSIVKKIISVP